MGEAAALGSAFLWALSNILMGSQSAKVPAAVISALRCIFAMAFLGVLAAVMLAVGGRGALPATSAAGLAGSGALGMGIGDTLYIRSLRHIGVSRAFPVSMAVYPLLTVALAVALIGEAVTVAVVIGTLLIVAGVVLVVSGGMPDAGAEAHTTPRRAMLVGGGLVVVASLLWALASIWLRSAADGVNPVLAQAVRLPAAAAMTAVLVRAAGLRLSLTGHDRGTLWALIATGVIGTAVGSLMFVFAVQQAGAARTAVLSSTSPLFALPMAALLLRERVSWLVIAGTALSIAGIWLVV